MIPLHADPLTKLLVLLLCILCASLAPSLAYQAGLLTLVALFGLLCGRMRYVLFLAIGAVFLFGLTILARDHMPGTVQAMLIAFPGLVHKVFPCGAVAGLLVSTTKVGEFMAAMNRMHIPGKVVIPLAVMLRYMPVIREDWHSIKDAMRLRGVAFSLRGLLTRPAMTVECVYVPLMLSASKAADELSIAVITRGIERPGPRTCLPGIHFRPTDTLLALCFLGYLLFCLYLRRMKL